MKGWFNGKEVNIEKIGFDELQRGFDYGDGLFETLFVKKGRPLFLHHHIDRIKRGLETLGGASENLDEECISNQIRGLWDQEGKPENSSSKIRVWRASGIGYASEEKAMNTLITLGPSGSYSFNQISSFGLITVVTNRPNVYSNFKSLSSLAYVLAGQEQLKNSWDEGLILDMKGSYSEGISSNLFVYKDGHWLTPTLMTGCIEGVMRRVILQNNVGKEGSDIYETNMNQEEIDLTSHLWFTINSLSVKYYLPEGTDRNPMEKMLADIKEMIG